MLLPSSHTHHHKSFVIVCVGCLLGVRFASFFSRSIIIVLLLLLALLFFVSIITSRINCHLSSVIIKILGSVVLADCIRNQLSFFMVSRAFVMPRQGGPMFYAENYAGFKKILERVKYYNQQAKAGSSACAGLWKLRKPCR